MLFEIDRDSLLNGLSKTTPITEKRTTLPILSHVLIEVSDSNLSLTATDLEVGLKITYDCEAKEPGLLAVPAKKFFEIIRELSSGPVSIQSDERNRMRIISGNADYELAGMDGTDYPTFSSVEGASEASVKPDVLIQMLDKVAFASSSDESRFNLNAVLLEQNEDKTRMVATDGHRLALVDGELGLNMASSYLVPKKGIIDLRRVLEDVKEEVSLGFDQKNLFVRAGRFMMTVRLIDGDYPDYRKVIPPESDTIVKARRADLLRTVKRVSILTSERNKGADIIVRPNVMEISTTHPDLGTARDSLDVDYQGDELTTIVNAAYLMEALGVIDAETVAVEFHPESHPIVMRPDPVMGYFNLVMPMKK